MTHRYQSLRLRQRGAAILTAMLLVTLVASLSAAALWQQWRGIEVEAAERSRLQAAWILRGALDWARLILREDARAGTTDHLAEPWAVSLQEARLSTFLASGKGLEDTSDDPADVVSQAFLSGQISDLQARLNVTNLVQDGTPHAPTLRAWSRLFSALRLPEYELLALVQNLSLALQANTGKESNKEGNTPLVPQTLDQLTWLGVSNRTIAALRPYAVVLPERTPVNLNTAPALVLHACISTLSVGKAQTLVAARARTHFRTLTDATQAMDVPDAGLSDGQHSVNTRFFEVTGQMRVGDRVVQERSVVQRDGLDVQVLRRDRGAAPYLQ
jgi:general secretion pathway protein K